MKSAYFSAPPSYYQGIANELAAIADAVGNQPHLNRHFAERLRELAKQMHEDLRAVSDFKLH